MLLDDAHLVLNFASPLRRQLGRIQPGAQRPDMAFEHSLARAIRLPALRYQILELPDALADLEQPLGRRRRSVSQFLLAYGHLFRQLGGPRARRPESLDIALGNRIVLLQLFKPGVKIGRERRRLGRLQFLEPLLDTLGPT